MNNFYQDCVDDSLKLQALIGGLKPTDTPQVMTLKAVISKAFAIKTKSGQAGFDLVSELARSLHVLCEEKMESPLAAPVLKIIAWHGRSINHLLAAKITGDGGETGKAILAEIEGLSIASL